MKSGTVLVRAVYRGAMGSITLREREGKREGGRKGGEGGREGGRRGREGGKNDKD